MRCSHGTRVVRPTVESVPFAFEGERIRQSQKEERPTRSRTSVRPRPSESELLVPLLTLRRIQSEGERQIDELSARRTTDFKTEQRNRSDALIEPTAFASRHHRDNGNRQTDGRTEEASNPSDGGRYEEEGSALNPCKFPPLHFQSSVRPVCGLSRQPGIRL